MKVAISNRQRRHRVHHPRLRRLGRWLMDRARAAAPRLDCGVLIIILTDHAGIAPLQRTCFGREGSTDVITLRYAPVPPETAGSAEVVINLERAFEERRRKGGMDRELALYLAHGCDHLTGADDDTPDGRGAMRRRENRWLRKADELGYVRGLVKAEGP